MNDKRTTPHVDKTDASSPDLIAVAQHEAEDRAGTGRSDPATTQAAAAQASAVNPGTSAPDARKLDPRRAGDFPDVDDTGGQDDADDPAARRRQ